MNDRQLLELAAKAGGNKFAGDQGIQFSVSELERFAALVAERTREECARVCENTQQEYEPYVGTPRNLSYTCADAIRSMKAY